jgi:non-specific serine/threonine protein kinase
LSSFLGREHELKEVERLLKTTRLLTLTGAGGVGKSSLAIEAVRSLADSFPDGVALVELGAIAEAALVPTIVAQALGLREMPSRPVFETLARFLTDKHLLLLLDNCEHLVLACAQLTEYLLKRCFALKILATSREALRINGENIWRVSSLSLPKQPVSVSAGRYLPTDLGQSDAALLFVERAAAIQSNFEVTVTNARAVAEICWRLDGIPLAVELAAARVATLSVDQIARRLDDRFALLTTGSRIALPRHQTVRASIAWSYDLLEPAERRLFARISVFVGSFDLRAAEAVCAESPTGPSVVDRLDSLVAKSLLQTVPSVDELRLRVLETIREFGREQLAVQGETAEIGHRHATHYLERAIEANQIEATYDTARWLDTLDADQDNFRAAIQWAIERRDVLLGSRLAYYLIFFWYYRGYYRVGRALLDALLALPDVYTVPASVRAELVRGRGMLTREQGDYAAARADFDEAVAISRTAGDQGLLCRLLVGLGVMAQIQQDYRTARRALEEGIELARAVGEANVTANALYQLGVVALDGDQDYVAASRLQEESLALYQTMGNRQMVAVVAGDLARVARARGDSAVAHARLEAALVGYEALRDRGSVSQWLYLAAALAADSSHLARAVRLAGAAAASDEATERQIRPAIRRERDVWLESARVDLGEADFNRAWQEGHSLTTEQAVSYALKTSEAQADNRHATEDLRST